jgi:cyclophilin family peptidyl-prolyl cis-trans isomerase
MPRSLPTLLLVTLVAAMAVSACGGDDGDGGSSSGEAEATATAEQGPCEAAELPAPKEDRTKTAKPKLKLDPAKTWVATVTTNCGEFEITLDVERAPKTASAFAGLAQEQFFDDLTFHRVVEGFVIQGGDPLGNGQGGPGFSVREAPPADLAYTRGVVAMAKTGAEPAGTSGSQFFVVTGEDVGLPPDYALLGQVTSGQEVVDAIGVVPVQPGDVPVDPVVIESITVTGS